MTTKDSKATARAEEDTATEETPAPPPPDPEDHPAFVGRVFKRVGREFPDRVAYTVDDVVQLRSDGYQPK